MTKLEIVAKLATASIGYEDIIIKGLRSDETKIDM